MHAHWDNEGGKPFAASQNLMSENANPWRIGLQAARTNLVPGLILQAIALLLGVAYFFWPAFHAVLDHVAVWQTTYGVLFAMLSRMVFSGLIPFCVCLAMPLFRPRHPLADFLFNVGWWGFMGGLTCAFYALQGLLYGNAHTPATVTLKLATDMLLFTPFAACLLTSLMYLWKDNDYSWNRLRRLFGHGWYGRLVLPNLLPNWVVWAPAMAVIYTLPQPLQVHMSGLIGCFWSLMCLQIAALTNRTPARRTR